MPLSGAGRASLGFLIFTCLALRATQALRIQVGVNRLEFLY